MTETNNKKKKKLIAHVPIIALIAGLIILVVYFLVYQSKTHIYEGYNASDSLSLVCSTAETSGSDFFTNNAKSVKHEIRIIFTDDVIDKMSYEFRGEYGSWEAADADEGVLHAEYNRYLGGHGLNHESLTPVFQNVDGNLKISLYLESYKDMNSVIAKLFYIEEENMNVIAKNSITETKEYYENKGFSCIMND